MNRVLVTSDDEHKTLAMERDEARTLINFGDQPHTFKLLKGERLELISRDGISAQDDRLELPPMTLALLLSPSDEVENRQVNRRRRAATTPQADY